MVEVHGREHHPPQLSEVLHTTHRSLFIHIVGYFALSVLHFTHFRTFISHAHFANDPFALSQFADFQYPPVVCRNSPACFSETGSVSIFRIPHSIHHSALISTVFEIATSPPHSKQQRFRFRILLSALRNSTFYL